jgi:DNA topoisomerase-1
MEKAHVDTLAPGSVEPSDLRHDPVAAAEAAELRYVSDSEPGFTRKRWGRGFAYFTSQGKHLKDERHRKRIDALAIPPAWTDVWICRTANGHIQATGRDEKDRKQYIYHPRWREVRDSAKYDHVIAFGKALPTLRRRISRDLAQEELNKEKVTAAVVKLLETTLIRVGNDEYAQTNKSYGLTTMRDRHVDIHDDEIEFSFVGKSGKEHHISLRNKRLADIVKQCQDIPGYQLFQYFDQNERHVIDSSDINSYLQEVTGESFTAKDFRTWAGTVLAAEELHKLGPGENKTDIKRKVSNAIKEVALRLGNTPTVCRQCYVHPKVLNSYVQGEFPSTFTKALDEARSSRPSGLKVNEAALLEFLKESV